MNSSLSPCRVGSVTIKNRFVMTAANLGWCRDGYVNDRVSSFYRKRAEGGVGLIIAGAAGIDPKNVNTVSMMQIYDDCFIGPMKKMTDQIHKAGTRIFLQLMHAGAYAKSSEHGGAKAVAPCAYHCPFTGEESRELTIGEIKEITAYFGEAALRAKKAGFDGIEIIGSAGYLVSEFLSKKTNQRKDCYGGSISGRTLFLREVIKAIRQKTGRDYPLIVRLSGSDFIPGGNGPEDFLAVAKVIEKDVDAINVTGGWHESRVPQITWHVPKGLYLYLAKALKETVSVPVIGCNRLDAATARWAIENGFCDMAGILRGLIADPCLVQKEGQKMERRVRPCLACNQDCLERIFSGKDLACVVNPLVGREEKDFKPLCKGRKILVIGAGPAGLAYALMAAPYNQVAVWEKEDHYGGSGLVTGKVPHREEVRAWIDYLYQECVIAGVHFEYGHEADEDELLHQLKRGSFDRLLIACGAVHPPLSCPCPAGTPVITAEECILNHNPSGKRIVVLGSSFKAVQTVQYLLSCGNPDEKMAFFDSYAPDYRLFAENVYKKEKNRITLLTSAHKIGQGLGKSTKWLNLSEIKRSHAELITDAVICRISADTVFYVVDGEERELVFDLLVDADRWQSCRSFQGILNAFPGQTALLGDARRPGRLSEAVRDAFEAAFYEEMN